MPNKGFSSGDSFFMGVITGIYVGFAMILSLVWFKRAAPTQQEHVLTIMIGVVAILCITTVVGTVITLRRKPK